MRRMAERGWWRSDDDIADVADAFQDEQNEGVPVPRFDGTDEEAQSRDALGVVIGISAGLIVLLSVAIMMLWVWSGIEGVNIGGPPSALLTWEEEYRDLTGFNAVGGDEAGVVLCIVDSGLDLEHPDLEQLELAGWLDAIDGIEHPYDNEGHGTARAGIVDARVGMHGNAHGVSLVVAKAIGEEGTGDHEQIADAVDWCVEQQADIVSLSLGGDQGFGSGFFSTDALEQSVEAAIDEGVYVVAAAGNDGADADGDVESPGSVEDVICLGAITLYGQIRIRSPE